MTAVARKRVLIVDDEPGMRETLLDILEADGYDVTTAVDGQDAVDQVRDHPVDVVVMDIRMPNRDGVSAMQDMMPPPPTIVLMTAYAVEERLRTATASRAFAILHKPFSISRLKSVLESIPDRESA